MNKKLIEFHPNGRHVILDKSAVIKLLKTFLSSERLSNILGVGKPWINIQRRKLGVDIQLIRKYNIGKYWKGRKRTFDKINVQKGIPYEDRYGKKRAKEICKKLSKKRKPFIFSLEHEFIKSLKIRLNRIFGLIVYKKIIPWNKGKTKYTDERLMKISEERIADKNCRFGKHPWNYTGKPTIKRPYESNEYSNWRDSVYQRDKYTCQNCGRVGGTLNAHHILPWEMFPDECFNITNGITLCKSCHKIIESIQRNS